MADEQLKPLQHQVAGHPSSVLTSSSGEWIIKPSLPLEVEFYEHVAKDHFPDLISQSVIPAFYGTEHHDVLPVKGPKNEQAIKLENLTHGFTNPNVLDIKLGTQLFDPLDPRLTPEKQERMESESSKTTSGSDGVRLTGFTVYDSATGKHISTPKEYGKSIPSRELVDGIRRFFPCSSEDANIHSASDLTPPPPKGQSAERVKQMLQNILLDVVKIHHLEKDYEWRIYGSSLLITYEGNEAAEPKHKVKHIDFAHTRHTPGTGPDQGLVKGLETVIWLLETRLKELELLL